MSHDGSRCYDRQGKPLSLREWAALLESDTSGRYRTVAKTQLPDGSELSTVWLGLDHAWYRGGRPLIFETMRFAGEGSGAEEFPDPETGEPTTQLRYSTEAEAQEAHARIVALLEQAAGQAGAEARRKRRWT